LSCHYFLLCYSDFSFSKFLFAQILLFPCLEDINLFFQYSGMSTTGWKNNKFDKKYLRKVKPM